MATNTFDTGVSMRRDIAIGLVSDAWAQACRHAGRNVTEPAAIVPLKSQKPGRKSGVYRLEGIEPPVVAKRCRRDSGLTERQVYERILPATGLRALAFYGCVNDPADPAHLWLFLEDAGSAKLMQSDRALAARWLARLHTSAASLPETVSLPERGPAHYFEHLRTARGSAECCVKCVSLSAGERAILDDLRRLLDRVEMRWEALCEPCSALPRTLVHGDVARKNSRLRATPDGPAIVMLDWETAGWGPPAVDLKTCARPAKHLPGGWDGTVPLEAYAAAVAEAWPAVTLRDVQRHARTGTVFRLLAGIRWASELLNVGSGATLGVAKLVYLSEALANMKIGSE